MTDLSTTEKALQVEHSDFHRPQQINRPNEPLFGRRSLLRKLGAVAAGAVAVNVVSGVTRPAAAALNDPILVGQGVSGSGASTPVTLLKVTNLAASADAIFSVTDGAAPNANFRAAIAGAATGGSATGAVRVGVSGIGTGNDSVGLAGIGPTGVLAASNSIHLKMTDATGSLAALPTVAQMKARFWVPGEIAFDRESNLNLGTAIGSFHRIAGPATAGALHLIAPSRVYDSRSVSKLTPGTNRIISLTGLESGVRGVLVTLTITGTEGVGFLTVTAGNVASTAASSVNWFASGQDLANTVVSAVSSNQIRVFNNSTNATNFIVDVVGYYL